MTHEDYKLWLAALKPGDKAAVKQGSKWRIYAVERLTVTQIVTKSGAKFNRKDGYRIGCGSWDFSRIEPVNQEAIDSMEEDRLLAWLRAPPGNNPSLDLLRAIKAAHDKAHVDANGLVEVAK